MAYKTIFEALTDLQIKDALSMSHGNHKGTDMDPDKDYISPEFLKAREIFLNKFPKAKEGMANTNGKREFQIVVPVTLEANYSKNILDSIGWEFGWGEFADDERYEYSITLEQYLKDLCIRKNIDTNKSTLVKLGSVLKLIKDNSLYKRWMHDPARQSKNKTEYDIIISGHPIDVYGMSTGRGWSSCFDMGLKFKNNSPNVPDGAITMHNNIGNHTHVVYLVPRGGDIDHDAICRITYNVAIDLGGDITFSSEGTVYGTGPSGFKQKAQEIMELYFDAKEEFLAWAEEKGSIYHDAPTRVNLVALTKTNPSFDKLYSIFIRLLDNKQIISSDPQSSQPTLKGFIKILFNKATTYDEWEKLMKLNRKEIGNLMWQDGVQWIKTQSPEFIENNKVKLKKSFSQIYKRL